MHLLQVCNVGNICGGTAACAWTITRALPDCRHTVIFLSSISSSTTAAFAACTLVQSHYVDTALIQRIDPDVVILHNVSQDRISQDLNPLSGHVVTIQYQHSAGNRAPAHLTLSCSEWLASKLQTDTEVLYQAVPVPAQPPDMSRRELSDEIVIGRICTPQARKWPSSLIDLYHSLAAQHPDIYWEFVGAPSGLEGDLQRACDGNAIFHQASPGARSLLWNWHALLYHHPTLTESFGRTTAEAMRAGCVPIVDARGGFCDQILNQQTGFLCKTATDFSTAITCINQREDWWRLSRYASTVANQRFSLRRMREQLFLLFRQGTLIERS